ncbi:glycosyl transferase-like protein [Leishmania tarentolae]|uniref:Glycosyl transferase-like protein n=1 Tax=Leishmania tarentolae TaxID=5689 RepID=A0A640KWQ2_LEITA|nr:glycosyl transferase-like protein [Leishmania tarentolae]
MRTSHHLRLETASGSFSLERIFVINLDRRPDRWSAIQAVCSRAGLPEERTERISAVEGSLVNVQAAHRCGFVSALGLRRLKEPPEHHIWGMDLNKAALGCALSHIHLWARIATLGKVRNLPAEAPAAAPPKQCFLVLEDDSTLANSGYRASDSPLVSSPPPFLDQLQCRMNNVPPDWELVYVSGLDTARQCPHMQVAEGVARVPQYHRTTNAYLLTPQGARRLLATCIPLTFQLDTAMTMNVGYPPGVVTGVGVSTLPHVLDPICYTLQPPLMQQAAQLGTDIQH